MPRRCEEFDVIHFGIALRINGLPYAPGKTSQSFDAGRFQLLAVRFHQEEPITTPGYVSRDDADFRHIDRNLPCLAKAGDVGHRDRAVGVQPGRDNADGRFDAVFARLDAIQMGERGHQADHAVPAHAQVADVIEEDHAGRARSVARLAKQSANEHVGAAWLIDDRRTKTVVLLLEGAQPFGQRARPQFRPAVHHKARWLAAGMRIDGLNFVQQGSLRGRG